MRIPASQVRASARSRLAVVCGLVVLAGVGPVWVLPLVASQAPAQVAQTGQQPAEQPPGTGLVLGQVLDAGSKRPVAGATVTISGGNPVTVVLPGGEVVLSSPGSPGTPPPPAPRQILTDADGHFLFRALTAGRYQIRASLTGYIGSGYGQLRPNGSSQTLELTRDDEKRGDLTVWMWKSATISGTIVDEAGEPVISCPVRAVRRTVVNGRPRYSAYTSGTADDRGVYRIPNLPPGEYLVAVMSTQTTMPAATADAYMQQMMAGGSATSEISRDLSNSGASSPLGGGYRIGDLILQTGMFGRGGGIAPAPAPEDRGRLLAYPAQYYPSARVAAQASVLTVASGEDRAGVDMQLKLQPTVRVSGTVIGPEGPVRNLGVKLFPVGSDDFSSESGIETASTATDASGAFTFLGVVPGQYTLKCLRVPRPTMSQSVMTTSIEVVGPNGMMMGISSGGLSNAPAAPLPTDLTLWATVPINVGEADMAGLSVALRPGARITGRLVFEGTKEPPTGDQLQRASLQISPIGGATPLQISMAAKRVEANGQFGAVGYPPGRYMVSASVPIVPPGGVTWRVKTVTFGGRNVFDEGLAVEGEDIAGLVITFTDRPTEVRGTVNDAKGQPDRNASVVILPADTQVWRQDAVNSRRVRSVRASSTGAFSFADLPPGAYFIAAISEDSMENWQDAKTLEAITRVATRFDLGDGEKIAQSLTTRILR